MTDEIKTEVKQEVSIIEEAKQLKEEMTKLNQETKSLIEENKKLKAETILAGKSSAGSNSQEVKVETPLEYKNRIEASFRKR